LLRACIKNNTQIARLLLENGATLGASDDQGNSELSHAARHGNLELTKLLLEWNPELKKSFELEKSPEVEKSPELKKSPELEKVNVSGMSLILWAAVSGNVSVGLYLLKKGADINAIDHSGFTALHWSSFHNKVQFMGLLLGETVEDLNLPESEQTEVKEFASQLPLAPFNIEATSKRGETPLLVAASEGQSEAVSVLLKHSSNFMAQDEFGRTALHHAVKSGEPKNETTLNRLLEVHRRLEASRTIISAKDCRGETALQIAVSKGYKHLVEILLQEIRPQSRNIVLHDNSEERSALSSAAHDKKKEIVQLLVNHEMDVIVEEEEDGFKWARIERSNTKQVDSIGALLWENKECWETQPDSKQKTIFWAARNGRLDLVRERSRESKDLNIILYWAAVGGQGDIVALLLDEYKDKMKNEGVAILKEDGCEAVMVAAGNGHENVVKQLLKTFMQFGDVSFQADISELKTENWTAVQWAIHYNTLNAGKIVKHLLMKGAIPELPKTAVANNRNFVTAVEMARALKGKPQFDEEIIAVLETPLRIAPQPLSVAEPKIDAPWMIEVCKRFSSRIIDFYTSDGRFFALDRNSVVEDTIYSEGPDTCMSRARKAWGIESDLRFRWIHLPANNVSMFFYVYLLLSLFTC
jgi:ankyrin repeat protein